jgi:hypothetical protein
LPKRWCKCPMESLTTEVLWRLDEESKL